MLNKSYAVFGLGRYGKAVAKELAGHGVDVLAVDANEELVNSLALEIPFCKCADVTNPEVLKQLEISNFDVVIIAMSNNLEASVLSIMHCKEVGVKRVIAKCLDETHQKVLLKVGADKVVFPEQDSGTRLAKNLLSSGFVDMVELSKDYSLVEVDVKDEWIGKSIVELDLRKKYSINIVSLKRDGKLIVEFDPKEPLKRDTRLVLIGKTTTLNKIADSKTY